MKRFRLINWLSRRRAPKPRVNVEMWIGPCAILAVSQTRGDGYV